MPLGRPSLPVLFRRVRRGGIHAAPCPHNPRACRAVPCHAAPTHRAQAADSHPYAYGPSHQILWMEDGGGGAPAGLSALRDSASQPSECWHAMARLATGATDAEIAGARFTQHLVGGTCDRRVYEPAELIDAMTAAVHGIQALYALPEGAGRPSCGSSLNLAATDGRTASRFVTTVRRRRVWRPPRRCSRRRPLRWAATPTHSPGQGLGVTVFAGRRVADSLRQLLRAEAERAHAGDHRLPWRQQPTAAGATAGTRRG